MSDFIAQLPTVVLCLLICTAKATEVALLSLKTVMMVKGERFKATILAFIECLIWGLVVSSVITTLGNNFLLLFFYCLGYCLGLFIGSTIENKIALGTSRIEMIANEENTEKITEFLREKEKGFTIIEGKGAKEKVNMIFVIVPRKEVGKITKEISKICEGQIFEITDDINRYSGGYGIGNKK